MILHYVNCGFAGRGDWDTLYLDTLEQWTLDQDNICPPHNLSSLEIHLQLCEGGKDALTTPFQLKFLQVALRAVSGAFGHLRTQDSGKISILVSYQNPPTGSPGFDRPLTKEEISNLTTNFRNRMLYPTASKDTRTTDAIASEVLRSEKAVERLENLNDSLEIIHDSLKVRQTMRRRLSIEINNDINWQNGEGRGDLEQ